VSRALNSPEIDAEAEKAASAAAALRQQLKEAERVAKDAEARRQAHATKQAEHMALAQTAAALFVEEANAMLNRKMITPMDWLTLGSDLYDARERLNRACEAAADGAPEPVMVKHVVRVTILEHPTSKLERVLEPIWRRDLPLMTPR
jgi:hypothetical protein